MMSKTLFCYVLALGLTLVLALPANEYSYQEPSYQQPYYPPLASHPQPSLHCCRSNYPGNRSLRHEWFSFIERVCDYDSRRARIMQNYCWLSTAGSPLLLLGRILHSNSAVRIQRMPTMPIQAYLMNKYNRPELKTWACSFEWFDLHVITGNIWMEVWSFQQPLFWSWCYPNHDGVQEPLLGPEMRFRSNALAAACGCELHPSCLDRHGVRRWASHPRLTYG